MRSLSLASMRKTLAIGIFLLYGDFCRYNIGFLYEPYN